jgi:hypothetical protein
LSGAFSRVIKPNAILFSHFCPVPQSSTTQPNFALLIALAWLLAMLQLVAQHWASTAHALLDTDDAMRLVQMRDFIAGQSWYDLHQARLNPPAGYDSHWSRLIDAGLAGLLWMFGRVFDPAMAERLMRTIWPMLWLLPTMGGAAAIAWRIAGREAAVIALLLGTLGLQAFSQFRPGRIDHHNVQIALSLLLVAATVWSDRMRWAAATAGLVTALALAIGLECLPYLIVCGIAFALRYVADPEAGDTMRHYGIALAAGAVLTFFAVVGPLHWTQGHCDAIGINWVALMVAAGLGLAFAGRCAIAAWRSRLVLALTVGAISVSLFIAIEPRCLRGPFAHVDASLWPTWLDHVPEMQPLFREMTQSPLTTVGIAAFPALAAIAAIFMLRDGARWCDFGVLTAIAAFAAAALSMVAMIKGYAYATWLGIPLVATLALRLFALLRLTRLPARAAVGLLFTPALVSLGAVAIADAASFGRAENNASGRGGCRATASYADLARLPPGLVAGTVELGPFLLALTPHEALAAPYHRDGEGVAAAHAIFAAPPDEARRLVADKYVTYVAACGQTGPYGLSRAQRAASLWSKLEAGEPPAWLEQLNVSGPIAIYRVK